jgi:hypothetical protein
VGLSGALKVIRRALIRLLCSHVKNWGENSVRALSFVRNPLSAIMNGFMVTTMNPMSRDVAPRCAQSDQRRRPSSGRLSPPSLTPLGLSI